MANGINHHHLKNLKTERVQCPGFLSRHKNEELLITKMLMETSCSREPPLRKNVWYHADDVFYRLESPSGSASSGRDSEKSLEMWETSFS
jgi:hypothetical protein